MKKLMEIRVILSALFIFTAIYTAPSLAAEPPIDTVEKLQTKIIEIQQDTGITALGIAVVDRGELVWLDALGQANVEHQVAATPDTLFRIGSTSKMFVALAALKLVEEGRLDLNAPLRELAPEIVFDNPWESEHPLRLVHLLEHTSGWNDMLMAEYAHNESDPIALQKALTLFTESRRSRWVPGTRFAYCNIGSGVVAYVVEKITGVPFETYVQENFFNPLAMESATYFLPEDVVQKTATAYVEGKAQDYWHIIYRPAGAINASPRDMVQLLQFFLQRGAINGQQLLTPASIVRMETPQTTLANPLGVTAGYGLANYTSGFQNRGVSFHGHNGGVIGAASDFAYSPAVNGGYVLMLTGNPSGMEQITDSLREYLLRSHRKAAVSAPPLPQQFHGIGGIYKPINPRNKRLAFMPTFLSAMTFSVEGDFVRRMPLAGGWPSPSNDYALNDQLLVDQWSGLPSIARVNDPLAGEAVQVQTDLFQKTSAFSVWGELVFFVCVFLLSALALVYSSVWVPLNLYRKNFRSPAVSIRLWPTLASLALLATLARLVFLTMDFAKFTPWTNLSISLFAFTLAYGVLSAWSVINCYRLRAQPIRKLIRIPACLLSVLNLAMAIYLAKYGMIGMQIWTW